MQRCKNKGCNKPLPLRNKDSIGRRKGRTSPFCSKKCANEHFKRTHPNYWKQYYKSNKKIKGEIKCLNKGK